MTSFVVWAASNTRYTRASISHVNVCFTPLDTIRTSVPGVGRVVASSRGRTW